MNPDTLMQYGAGIAALLFLTSKMSSKIDTLSVIVSQLVLTNLLDIATRPTVQNSTLLQGQINSLRQSVESNLKK